ncbi:MAG: tetratricopeptide repeat protein [Bacteroidales bacterium]
MERLSQRATFLIFAISLVFQGLLCAQDLNVARQLFTDRKYDESARIFSSVAKGSPAYAESRYYLGQIATRKSDLKNAEKYLEEAVAADQKNARYHQALGAAYGQIAMSGGPLKQASYAGKIKSCFELAAKFDPNDLTSRWMLFAFYLYAPKVMGGSPEKATSTASELLRINPAEGNRALGMIHQRNDRNDLAERYFKMAVNLAPDSLKHHSQLGSFYQSVANYDQAWVVYDKALTRFPGSRSLLYESGKVSALSGKNLATGEKALNDYINGSGTRESRNVASAYYYLGLIEKSKGNKSAARKQFEQALKLNPDHKPSQEAIKESL